MIMATQIQCEAVPAASENGSEASELLFRMSIPALTRYLSEARAVLHGAVDELQAPLDVRCDLLLAFGEACGNAVLYSSNPAEGRIEITCRLHRHRNAGSRYLEIEIRNQGTEFQPDPESDAFRMPAPAQMTAHGRGLPMIKLLTDRVDYLAENGATIVRLVKDLP